MSKRPMLFPANVEKPNTKLDWRTIPFFSGYQLGLPDMVIRDMRWEEKYPNGVLVPQGIAKGHLKKHIGQKFSKLVADDGVVYKAFINDILDLVVKDNNKEYYNNKFNTRPDKLPLDFRPVGTYNYTHKGNIVKEYWEDRRYRDANT